MATSRERPISGHHEASEYFQSIQRGKGALQLKAMRDALTKHPAIRKAWDAATFTPFEVDGTTFDELECNLAYHFHQHGQRYGTIEKMTAAAQAHFDKHKGQGRPYPLRDGKTKGLKLPDGSIYTVDGKIVTFLGDPP